jgi:hypothetical protein
MTRCLALVAILLLLSGETAAAQRLSGTVRERRSGQPVGGAIVSILAGTGVSLSETLTDRAGTFRLTIESTARRIRIRRIGFVPVELTIPDSAHSGDATLTIALDPVPVVLDPVITTATCRGAKNEGQALALWEQARLGFLASVVARTANPAQVKLVRFRRANRYEEVVGQEVLVYEFTSTKPFSTALTPEQLVSGGFVVKRGEGRIFHGMDLDLLASDAFLSTHCFDLAPPDSAHRGQIGIAFTPARGRVRLVEVSGTIWLDESPLALRSLDFLYENLTDTEMSAGVGGGFSFFTADNGVVLLDRWELRILAGVLQEGPPEAMLYVPVVQVDGGQVVTAQWPDGASFKRVMPTIDGLVVEATTGRPLGGVQLDGNNTSYQTTSAADGTFSFQDVFPGPYNVYAVDSWWAPFGLQRTSVTPTRVNDGAITHALRIELPSVGDAIRARCGRMVGTGPILLAGRVIDADGNPRKARIEFDRSKLVSSDSGSVTVATTDQGYFSLCGLHPGWMDLVAIDMEDRRTYESVKIVEPSPARLTIAFPR